MQNNGNFLQKSVNHEHRICKIETDLISFIYLSLFISNNSKLLKNFGIILFIKNHKGKNLPTTSTKSTIKMTKLKIRQIQIIYFG